MKGGWIPAVAGMLVFFLHFVGAFMSWSLTFGHAAAAHTGDTTARLWPVLSFPLFAMLPATTLDANWSIQTRAGIHCAPRMHAALGTAPAGTLRLSVGHFTTDVEIDAALAALAEVTAE